MKGLELARGYFSEVALPVFREKAGQRLSSMAFGLAGPGSECYGYDDEISRDHDWGPRLCIWIPEELYREEGERLQRIYDRLDPVFQGYGPVRRVDDRSRDGILSVERFYRSHLGTDRAPETLRDWLLLPEEGLSLCTNGEVFQDPLGSFTRMRRALLSYFPRDLWLKKIASRCRSASRHGQYDLWRALRRADRLTAGYHQACFAREAAALVFLLNRSYRPFAKWIFHGLPGLGRLGCAVHGELLRAAEAHSRESLQGAVERCAAILIDELVGEGLAERRGDFLFDCGAQIEGLIRDRSLREELDSVD
ncbi:MAG: DUF4037 domain-containing protein [Spirochaetales bacterium]|nr:DUF4037 domain-containing protein [Spirochaetales bacterium]